MTTEKTVQELATELSRAFVTDKRNDGQGYVHLANGSPEWMTDVVRAIHGDKLPDDTTYRFIERCADAIADSDGDARDAVMSIEADVYTNDLTAWLHARVDHVYYLSEALEEYSPTDGFQALALAQHAQIEEIGFGLVAELEKLAGEQDEE